MHGFGGKARRKETKDKMGEWILRRLSRGEWSGFSWLRIGTVGGLLRTW